MEIMQVEIFSFFAGLGLLDLGFENAGFNVAFVNELDQNFLRAYQYARCKNGTTPKYGYNTGDIRTLLNNQVWKNIFNDYSNRKNKLIGFIGGPPLVAYPTVW